MKTACREMKYVATCVGLDRLLLEVWLQQASPKPQLVSELPRSRRASLLRLCERAGPVQGMTPVIRASATPTARSQDRAGFNGKPSLEGRVFFQDSSFRNEVPCEKL